MHKLHELCDNIIYKQWQLRSLPYYTVAIKKYVKLPVNGKNNKIIIRAHFAWLGPAAVFL